MSSKKQTAPKKGLHPRNPHLARYDFPQLTKALPELSQFVAKNPYGDLSVNFSESNGCKSS